MARPRRYALVRVEHISGKKAAEAQQALQGGTLYPLAETKCPKGADHAHEQYDGADFCRSCKCYFGITISKSEGRFSR